MTDPNREFKKILRRRALDRRLIPRGTGWKQAIKSATLRHRHLAEIDDASLLPPPRKPKPPRRDKRGPGKPGRRM